MVYGRILYNNIKEYTPKWMKTVPYSQTTKPTFGRKPQVISNWNNKPAIKGFWLFVGKHLQRNPWAWQMLIFVIAYGWFHLVYDPFLWIYRANNKHRTLDYALNIERAHKKKLKDAEDAEEAAQAATQAKEATDASEATEAKETESGTSEQAQE